MVSSCAKFILGGEHSVLHSGKALAFPLTNLRLNLQRAPENSEIWVNDKKLEPHQASLIFKIKQQMKIDFPDEGMKIHTQIPIGAGLGSSAAICVAVAKAYTDKSGRELAELALEGEKIFHGTPSGVDPFTVALEKPIAFSASKLDYRELNLSEFTKNDLVFGLYDSKERHSTVELIAKVKKLKTDTPLIWEDLVSTLASNALEMERALEKQPLELGRIMNDSHFRLLQLGVSTEGLDDLVQKLRDNGALGAKLTGAGGGGFALALFRQSDLNLLPMALQPTYRWCSNDRL